MILFWIISGILVLFTYSVISIGSGRGLVVAWWMAWWHAVDWVVARRFRVEKRRKGKNERKKVGVWGEV